MCLAFKERNEGRTHAARVRLRCYRDNRNPQAVRSALLKAMGHVSPAPTACCLFWIDPVVEHVAGHISLGLAAGSEGSHD